MHSVTSVRYKFIHFLSVQEAVAEGLEFELTRKESPDCYFKSLSLSLLPKRDQLAQVLESLGMHPVVPEGGYFMLADTSQMSELLQLNLVMQLLVSSIRIKKKCYGCGFVWY